jgi:hypothetical protein
MTRFALLIRIFTLIASFLTFYLKNDFENVEDQILCQNSNYYLGPKSGSSNNQLVRIQLIMNDSPKNGGPQLLEVYFNDQSVPLKPRDIFGSRGQASFQLPAKSYSLKWKLQLDKENWPRTQTKQETIIIDPKDMWIQITIEGDKVTIS